MLAPRPAVPYDAGDSSRAPSASLVMPNLDFTLTGEFVELHNLLKITGLADSGGSAKVIVASGAVKVDGAVELRKTCKIARGRSYCSAIRASRCTARSATSRRGLARPARRRPCRRQGHRPRVRHGSNKPVS